MEAQLKALGLPWVRRFDRRLAAVALFTEVGVDPAPYARWVDDLVAEKGYDDDFYVTHSSVAVDIVPHGVDKMTGLLKVADGAFTVGITDSLNDLPMHLGADIGFAPKNISNALTEWLAKEGRIMKDLADSATLEHGRTYVAKGYATEGVIEILKRLGDI